jgi:predicted dehydrogenase
MKDNFTVSLIGCGNVGYLWDKDVKDSGALTHFKAVNDDHNFKIKAITEPNENIRSHIQANHPKIQIYKSHAQMFRNILSDLVIISVPDDEHEKVLSATIKSNPMAIFIEKPLVKDISKTSYYVNLLKREKILTQVNYFRRFLQEYQDIKERLENNFFGRVLSVTIRYSRGLLHNGSHYLDLLAWFFGTPNEINKIDTFDSLNPSDPTIAFLLRFDNAMHVYLIGMDDSSDCVINEIDIIGEKSRVHIDTFGNIIYYEKNCLPNYRGFSSYIKRLTGKVDYREAIPNALANIAAALQQKEVLLSPADNSIQLSNVLKSMVSKQCQI